MKTFKLHLIRHGMTAGNLQGLYIGSGTDIPLCDEGRAQLNELKERFEYPQVDTVFSSPLMRAVETANILFPNATHQFSVHDLREAGFGVFENRPVKELVKDEDFKKWITPGSGYVPEGAEPTDQFHARCAESLMKLFEYMIRMDVTEAACVTHGGVIMSMLSQRAVPTRRPEQWMADPGCGYTVQTDVQLSGKLVQTFIDFLLQRNAVVLNFKVEMLPVKNIEELLAEVIRAVHIAVRQRTRNRARQTGRQTNQTFAVRAQQLHVDTRLHIEAFRETARHHVDEVAVAGHVLAQQDEVRVPLAVDVAAVKARMRRQIHLAADDRMDPLGLAGAVKVDHAVHDAMVGQRARGLPQLCHTVHQLFDTAGAVQQAVFAVDMQMCKWYQFSPPFPQAR